MMSISIPLSMRHACFFRIRKREIKSRQMIMLEIVQFFIHETMLHIVLLFRRTLESNWRDAFCVCCLNEIPISERAVYSWHGCCVSNKNRKLASSSFIKTVFIVFIGDGRGWVGEWCNRLVVRSIEEKIKDSYKINYVVTQSYCISRPSTYNRFPFQDRLILWIIKNIQRLLPSIACRESLVIWAIRLTRAPLLIVTTKGLT